MRPPLFIIVLLIVGCASQSLTQDELSATRIAESQTCAQIDKHIDDMENIIASATPSQTEQIVKDTAIQTAQTGVHMSGVLGSAGAFAGIGVNFLRRMYSANANTRQQEMKDIAATRQSILIEAYYLKKCEGDVPFDYAEW